MELIAPELLEVANSAREQYKELPETVIRRRVRDALEAAKSQPGQLTLGGIQALEEQLVRKSDNP
jgi:hypothetical protein